MTTTKNTTTEQMANASEEKVHLEKHVQQMQTQFCSSSLEYIAKQLNLVQYFKLITEDSVSVLTTEICKHHTLLTYEGGLHSGCTEQEARALFLASLLRNAGSGLKAKHKLAQIHELVTTKKQISENVYNLTVELLNLGNAKPVTLKDKIYCDALDMIFYSWDMQMIENFLHVDYAKDLSKKGFTSYDSPPSFELWLQNQIANYCGPKHKTNWAKVKAFKLNLPQVVKNRIGIILGNVKYTPGML